jgi:two-component system chemotaxis response regulator CheY
MRALIIDDSRAMRIMIGKIVKEFGFEIIEACDGQQGLAAVEASQPGLIFVDWNMPVMNGLEFIKAFRKLEQYASVPVIMVTTESLIGDVAKAIEAGATDYLMKPFDKDSLREKLTLVGAI